MFMNFPTKVFDFIECLAIPPTDKKCARIKTVLKFETLEKFPTTIKSLTDAVREADGLQNDDLLFVLLFMKKSRHPDQSLPTRCILIHKRDGLKNYRVQMEADARFIGEGEIDPDESFLEQVFKS